VNTATDMRKRFRGCLIGGAVEDNERLSRVVMMK
jgi:hypothetical protein